MLVRVLKVSGDSLAPRYRSGAYLLALSIPLAIGPLRLPFQPTLHLGDVVAFRHPTLGPLLKRIEGFGPGPEDLFVVGDAPTSIDSRQFGPISRRDVFARVLGQLIPPA